MYTLLMLIGLIEYPPLYGVFDLYMYLYIYRYPTFDWRACLCKE